MAFWSYHDAISSMSLTQYDYHSVDTGDIFIGRPYGYTEEYQSYEVVSHNTVSMADAYSPYGPTKCPHALITNTSVWNYATCIDNHIDNPSNVMGGCSYFTMSAGCALKSLSKYRGYFVGTCYYPTPFSAHTFQCVGGSSYILPKYCPGTYSSTPIYGYVTRTRVVSYDKQSGLFSLGVGVPYAARNTGLYSTR